MAAVTASSEAIGNAKFFLGQKIIQLDGIDSGSFRYRDYDSRGKMIDITEHVRDAVLLDIAELKEFIGASHAL